MSNLCADCARLEPAIAAIDPESVVVCLHERAVLPHATTQSACEHRFCNADRCFVAERPINDTLAKAMFALTRENDRLRAENVDLKADNAHLSEQNESTNRDCIELSQREITLMRQLSDARAAHDDRMADIGRLTKARDRVYEAWMREESANRSNINPTREEAIEALRKIVGKLAAAKVPFEWKEATETFALLESVSSIARAALPKTGAS